MHSGLRVSNIKSVRRPRSFGHLLGYAPAGHGASGFIPSVAGYQGRSAGGAAGRLRRADDGILTAAILGRPSTKGRGRSPSPFRRVCTLVCTLAYFNPMYVLKIILGTSGRIPFTYSRFAKIGVCPASLQSQRSPGRLESEATEESVTDRGHSLRCSTRCNTVARRTRKISQP